MKNILLSIFIAYLLSACGGGSSDTSTSQNTQLTGVWDSTTVEGSTTDISYTVFNSDGTFTDYDYMGDSFDNGPDCYLDYQGSYEDLGSGQYLIDNSVTVSVTLTGDTLQINTAGDIYTMTRTSLSESSFNLCNSSTPDVGLIPEVGLSTIEGVWDLSYTENGLLDEYYLVYRNGNYIEYDYQGDAFNNGANCYSVINGSISHISGFNYLIDNLIQAEIIVDNDILDFSFEDTLILSAPRSTLLESDFSPICN